MPSGEKPNDAINVVDGSIVPLVLRKMHRKMDLEVIGSVFLLA